MIAGIVWVMIEAALMAGCQTVLASPLLLCSSNCCLYKKILCVRFFFFQHIVVRRILLHWKQFCPWTSSKHKLRFVFLLNLHLRLCSLHAFYFYSTGKIIKNLFPVGGYRSYWAWVLLHWELKAATAKGGFFCCCLHEPLWKCLALLSCNCLSIRGLHCT